MSGCVPLKWSRRQGKRGHVQSANLECSKSLTYSLTHNLQLDGLSLELNGTDLEVDTDRCEESKESCAISWGPGSKYRGAVPTVTGNRYCAFITHSRCTTQCMCRQQIATEDMTFLHRSHRLAGAARAKEGYASRQSARHSYRVQTADPCWRRGSLTLKRRSYSGFIVAETFVRGDGVD